MVIGILGGTFDPPHLSHLALARTVLRSGLVEEAWLVPCVSHRFQKQPTGFTHRLAMCELLVEGEPRMKVSDMETRIDRPGHTLHLIRALQAAFPNDTFRLLSGTDIYHEKEQWHRYDEIAKLAPPIYVERGGVAPIPLPTLPAPPPISSTDIRASLARGERPLDALPQSIIDYIEKNALYGLGSV